MDFKKHRWLLLIMLGAILARIGFCLFVPFDMTGDAADYLRIANHLWGNGYFGVYHIPDNSRPPGYPFLLSLFGILTGNNVSSFQWTSFNVVCDVLSIFLLFQIGKRATGAASLFGIALVALSPIWFGHVNSAVTEPISITLYLLLLERWTAPKRTQRDLILCAFILSLLISTRSMFLLFPWAIVFTDWLLRAGKNRKISFFVWFKNHSSFLICSYVFPLLWGIRNAITMKEFTITQPETAKLMLWLGAKIPNMDFRVPELAMQYRQEPLIGEFTAAQTLAERSIVLDKLKQEGLQVILDNPLQYIEGLWIKFERLWVTGWYNPYSYGLTPQYGSNLYLILSVLPVLLLGILGLASVLLKKGPWSEAKRQATLQLLLCFYITGVTIPMSVDARYSLTAWVCFGLWVVPGYQVLAGWFRRSFMLNRS